MTELVGADVYNAFTRDVSKHFHFLLNDYLFIEVLRESHSHTYCIHFQNSRVKIELHLGLKDQEMYHKIHKVNDNGEYKVEPIKDLRPVCPNCHAMIHKRKESYTIEELKERMKNARR